MTVLFHLGTGCLRRRYWLSKDCSILLAHTNLLKNFRLVVLEINTSCRIGPKKWLEILRKISRWSGIHSLVLITAWTNLLCLIQAKISWGGCWLVETESILMWLNCSRGRSWVRRKSRGRETSGSNMWRIRRILTWVRMVRDCMRRRLIIWIISWGTMDSICSAFLRM